MSCLNAFTTSCLSRCDGTRLNWNEVDPASYNAVQEISKVMSAVSRAVTPQEHLQALTGEAKLLMLEVAEAKSDRRIRWALRVVFAATGILIAIAFSPALLP
jgi:hypothetical protein